MLRDGRDRLSLSQTLALKKRIWLEGVKANLIRMKLKKKKNVKELQLLELSTWGNLVRCVYIFLFCATTRWQVTKRVGLQLAGDKTSARNWYEKSGTRAARIGFKEGFVESREALRSIES